MTDQINEEEKRGILEKFEHQFFAAPVSEKVFSAEKNCPENKLFFICFCYFVNGQLR